MDGMPSDNQEVAHYEVITDPVSYTVQRDWVDLMPISHGAARLYRILRSMMVENKGPEGPRPTRALSIDQLCFLLSRGLKRPVGEQTIRDWRKELTDTGMLETIPGIRPSAPPTYRAFDIPPKNWHGWRNGWQLLSAYRKDWHASHPEPVPVTESENGQFTPRFAGGWTGKRDNSPHGSPEGTAAKGVPPGAPGAPPALSSAFEPLSKSLSNPPPPPSSNGRSWAVPQEEEEEDPRGNNRNPSQDETEEVLSELLRSLKVSLQGEKYLQAFRAVSDLLATSWTPVQISDIFTHTSWEVVRQPDNFVVGELKKAVGTQGVPTPVEVQQDEVEKVKAKIRKQKAEISACRECDEVGWTEEGWHGHGSKKLTSELWAAQNPELAAENERANAASRRKGS